MNVDLDRPVVDLRLDLSQPLPFSSESVLLIYSEHFLEHLTAEQGVGLMKECRRVLCPAGVMRIAMPDLDYIVQRYVWRWRSQDWITRYGYAHLENRAQMMNLMFHEWGHRYLHNEEELVRCLRLAGFAKIRRVGLGKSRHPELRGRETRLDSKLIVEASST